jgi:hypothetical protein
MCLALLIIILAGAEFSSQKLFGSDARRIAGKDAVEEAVSGHLLLLCERKVRSMTEIPLVSTKYAIQ